MQYGFLITTLVFFIAISIALFGLILGYKKSLRKKEAETLKEKEESARRLYEILILQEIGDRTGYSLDVEKVLSIITGSLHQFIKYSAVGYIVVGTDKPKLNIYLEESVDKTFLKDMKERMIDSVSTLLDKKIEYSSVDQVVSGAISTDNTPQKVGSFFNIPLVISGKLAGLMTIAHLAKGLYKEEDMTLLYKITSQASNAVTRLEEVVRLEEEKLSKVKQEFTSMIVHELRSPLDGMKKIVELIVSNKLDKNSPKFNEYIDLLHQSSSSTLELVNDILDYSKLQAGKFEINLDKANIKEIVDNRISFYKTSAESRKIKFLSNYDTNLPENSLFDERGVKQILNNFISNALKFTQEEGNVSIYSTLYDPASGFSPNAAKTISEFPVPVTKEDLPLKEKSIAVFVSDNGAGIPDDRKKDLFMTYKQINSTNFSEARGTGLGLVIAKGIAEGHKGFIGATSNTGIGSTFFFAIPFKQ